jgi:hypothetical protein
MLYMFSTFFCNVRIEKLRVTTTATTDTIITCVFAVKMSDIQRRKVIYTTGMHC